MIEQKKENDKRIAELSASINVWLGTSLTDDKKKRMDAVQEELEGKLLESLIHQQQTKIAYMEHVLSIIKDDAA